MTAPAAPPPGEPPLDALPPDAAATVEDVRATRRWTWVAFAWAIAASAIAVIALITANDNSNDRPTPTFADPTPRIDRLERQTNDRFDAFGKRLGDAASQDDVHKLDRRLGKAEDDATEAKTEAAKASDAIDQLKSEVDDLKQRVDNLAKKQQSQAASGTTSAP